MSKFRSSMVIAALSLALVISGTGRGLCQFREDLDIVEGPTAGIIPHGSYMYRGSVGPLSSLLFGGYLGVKDRLMLGVSFGVQNFVGRGEIDVNDRLGFEIRLRLLEEVIGGPALAFGIDTQGQDRWIEGEERYERKSKGFYAVISKSYYMLRRFSIHLGSNYTLENKYESGPDLFGGISIEAFTGLILLCEYSGAFDDNDSELSISRTRGKGYLDAGLRIDYKENLRLKMMFKDLLDNYKSASGVARSIEISYINYF